VNLTCFIDCCHSGTVTRVVEIGGARVDVRAGGARARFVPPSAALDAAHQRYRRSLPAPAGGRSAGPDLLEAGGGIRGVRGAADAVHGVLFSACQDREVAFENNGSGDFTRHATAVLRQGLAGLTNGAFLERVRTAFGAGARQSPNLFPADERVLAAALLQPLTAAPAAADRQLLSRLDQIEQRLTRLGV
jgi:hypothetical protein